MEVRGQRECRNCGATWSYFETGSVTCPECESSRSVGRGERAANTDRPVDLSLEAARSAAAADDIDRALELAAETARTYRRERGFVRAGDLLTLDDTYLLAQELAHATSILQSSLERRQESVAYLHDLLAPAESRTRPDPADVPESLRVARGLGNARAVRDYRDEVTTFVGDEPLPGECRSILESIGDHVARIEALDGDVEPARAERLVEAARAVGACIREDHEAPLDVARTALDELR
ncbi:MAG: TFIIB-type zinc ribbon-containing protein [Halanaeroarchaeum sp.]